MRLGLYWFIVAMWALVMGVAAFLKAFVAPISITAFDGPLDRVVISIIQATIAVVAVGFLVLVLGRMKRFYIKTKLGA